ncbi:hypothetical protein Y032_0006g3152 [Ancylostoma ceylanicum]|uniref:Uncharacterized protein n=1 Tax=Ancylostoma ceylanicum TaxID=53326 RepID=A0A016VSJ4_9BILA|nr:hypothetical protein Y032_0006g3152 [Ancylostoma ceylanicum]
MQRGRAAVRSGRRYRCFTHVFTAQFLYNEPKVAVDKERDRGAAFLGRDTEALHAGSGCPLRHGIRVLCCW